MADSGFTLETEQVVWLDREAIANVRLAERFRNLPIEDLRVANATMVHKLSGT
jgi:hypothetical protein